MQCLPSESISLPTLNTNTPLQNSFPRSPRQKKFNPYFIFVFMGSKINLAPQSEDKFYPAKRKTIKWRLDPCLQSRKSRFNTLVRQKK